MWKVLVFSFFVLLVLRSLNRLVVLYPMLLYKITVELTK